MYPLLVALAGRIASGVEPLLSPSEALEIASLPESATLDIVSLAGLARAARKPDAAFTCGSARVRTYCPFCHVEPMWP